MDAPRSIGTTAIVTASYAADFDRARILCDTMDCHVTGHARHILLVSDRDAALFRQLAGPRREVVSESEILPPWLHDLPDPLSLFRRRIWLSARTKPLRGWHVQQLRRIAIAAHVDEDALLYCDSDVAFVRPFECATLWHGQELRLFRRENRLDEPGHGEQIAWAQHAGKVLGLPEASHPRHDYIATLIAWRNDAVRSMCDRICAVSGQHWLESVASSRQISECMLYGRYADEVLQAAGHFHDGQELCRIYWKGPKLDGAGLSRFIADLEDHQVAIGLQSFTGTGEDLIRKAVLG